MAVRNRSTQINYVNELNADGVATQKELDNAINKHLTDYHQGEILNKFENGIKYFYDENNDRYLSNQLFMMDFSDNDTTTSNIYLYQKKNIRCNYTYNTLPFDKNILIDKVEVSLDTDKHGNPFNNGSNNLFDIENGSGDSIYTINTPNQKYTKIDNVNTIVTDEVKVYVNNTKVRRPVVKIWMRLIY